MMQIGPVAPQKPFLFKRGDEGFVRAIIRNASAPDMHRDIHPFVLATRTVVAYQIKEPLLIDDFARKDFDDPIQIGARHLTLQIMGLVWIEKTMLPHPVHLPLDLGINAAPFARPRVFGELIVLAQATKIGYSSGEFAVSAPPQAMALSSLS